jgi:hypothetical protein
MIKRTANIVKEHFNRIRLNNHPSDPLHTETDLRPNPGGPVVPEAASKI